MNKLEVLICAGSCALSIAGSALGGVAIGQKAIAGESAYDIAVRLGGFQGTEEEWLASLKGAKGDTGSTGQSGSDGQPGTNGTDGVTPHIGTNGNWWIGDTDTNISATGEDGQPGTNGKNGDTPRIGTNGNWWIGETDTEVPATGAKGADGKDGAAGKDGSDGAKGEDGEDGLTPYIGDNGNWWIGETDTEVPATGAKGADGKDGAAGKDGSDGAAGEDGEDGLTPYIGDNGNWWIGETDTQVPATGAKGADGKDGAAGKDGSDGADGADGENGLTPYIGDNGNWWIGETDTQVPATGAKGADGKDGAAGKDGSDGADGADGEDGLTPYIGDNGNWWIGETDTEVPATGAKGADGKDGAAGKDGSDGADGADGQDGADGKSAYEIAVENGFEGTEEEFAAQFKQGNISYLEWADIVYSQSTGEAPNYSPRIELSYNDIFESPSTRDGNLISFMLGYRDEPRTWEINTTASYMFEEPGKEPEEVVLTGKTDASLCFVGDEKFPQLSIKSTLSMNGEFIFHDEMLFTKMVDPNLGAQYMFLFDCGCLPYSMGPEDPTHYFIKIMPNNKNMDVEDTYDTLVARVVRDLTLASTSWQFSKDGYNVINQEWLGYSYETTTEFLYRVLNSKANYDNATGIYSLVNNSASGFEYEFKLDEERDTICETKSVLHNYTCEFSEYLPCELVTTTKISYEDVEPKVLENFTFEADGNSVNFTMNDCDYIRFTYSFGEVISHSTSNVFTCMMLDGFDPWNHNDSPYYYFTEILFMRADSSNRNFTVGQTVEISNFTNFLYVALVDQWGFSVKNLDYDPMFESGGYNLYIDDSFVKWNSDDSMTFKKAGLLTVDVYTEDSEYSATVDYLVLPA